LRILLVEDDSALSRSMTRGLEAEHFAVDWVCDGEEALQYLKAINYDIVLLDLKLPRLDGLSVLKRLRSQQMRMPVMVLSGRTDLEDRVGALEFGADDYLIKPYAFSEVMARVRALLRRPHELQHKLQVGDLELDTSLRIVTRAGRRIRLSFREYAVLEYLMRNVGRPVSRNMVLEHVWNEKFEGLTNIVDVYINYLRNKIDKGFQTKLLHTERGVGYLLSADEDPQLAQSA
jgi:DNA-binding response OmpR family regulator